MALSPLKQQSRSRPKVRERFQIPSTWKMCYWVENDKGTENPHRVTCLIYWRADNGYYYYAAAMYHRDSPTSEDSKETHRSQWPNPTKHDVKEIKRSLRITARNRAECAPRCFCEALDSRQDLNFHLLPGVIRQCMRDSKYGVQGPRQAKSLSPCPVERSDLERFVTRESKERAKKGRSVLPAEKCNRCIQEQSHSRRPQNNCSDEDCTKNNLCEACNDAADSRLCKTCESKRCDDCTVTHACAKHQQIALWQARKWDFTPMNGRSTNEDINCHARPREQWTVASDWPAAVVAEMQ
jgi:hypothetical protein